MDNHIVINESKSYKYCEDTRQLKNKLELGWLELCKRLYFIKSQNMADIAQYGGFELFLDEIKLKPQTAIHMMAVYKRFCVEFGIEEDLVARAGGYTRAYELLPMAKSPEKAREALEVAEQAPSRTSIKKYVQEVLSEQTGIPTEEEACRHDEIVIVRMCTCCKQKLSVSHEVTEQPY